MSGWGHPTCAGCWRWRNPQREAFQGVDLTRYDCCFCGGRADWGLFTRADPMVTPCFGTKGYHARGTTT